jgi:predicted anti-sigma-YlaC factor YlaD
MREHLSPDQFAKCFVDGPARPAGPELQHIDECPECRAEFERFQVAVSSFRTAVRDTIDARLAAEAMRASQDADRAPVARVPSQRWALVVALFAGLLLVPLLTIERNALVGVEPTSVETDPDALMGAINLHLLRTVPAPMEPLLRLVPEPTTKSGGTQ